MWYNRGIPIRKSGLPVETQKTDRSIHLLLALTTALWGSLYTANRVLLEAVPSFTLLCLRYLLSAAVDRVFTPVAAVQHVAGLVLHVIIKELQQVRPVFRILLVAPLLLVVDPEPLFLGADPAEALKGAVAVDLVAFTLALKDREFVKKLERSWN